MMLSGDVGGTVARILGELAGEVEPRGPWRWGCGIRGGGQLRVRVSAAGDFLRFSSELACSELRDLSRLLDWNETLRGPARFAIHPKTQGLCLKAEVVIQEDPLLLRRTAEALRGLHEACEYAASNMSCVTGAPEGAIANPVELLRETNWAFTENGPNEFSVNLEAEMSLRARLSADRFGVDAKVELLRTSETAPVRQALAVMLLTANGALRLVRGYASGKEDQTAYGFQCRLPPDCTVVELDHALAALSTACNLCEREALLLLDPTVAGTYLSLRGVAQARELTTR